MSKIKIKEIFESIQGEGPYIGYNQLFIRFCGCNLRCRYCDTNFSPIDNFLEFDVFSLLNEIKKYDNIHSVSLTGGEPLLSYKFLEEFLPHVNKKIYLETNATLYNEFLSIKDYIDIVSADIKLKSATGNDNNFKLHRKFFELCSNSKLFAKVVFNESITDDEIFESCKLCKDFDIELILQPEMKNDKIIIDSKYIQTIFNKFLNHYDCVRLIAQMHKYINIK